jgi:hypothetical protein
MSEFNYVYKLLQEKSSSLEKLILESKNNSEKAELIGNKNLIKYSIEMLKKCNKYNISPSSVFTQLPKRICQSPSSSYRIIEDQESDNKNDWVEVHIENKQFNRIELGDGDITIEV